MVPNGWSLSTFDNAGIIVTDGDRGKEYPKAIDFFEDEYCLFLSAKNVTKQGFLFEDNQFITEAKDRKLRKGRVNKGDVVLTTRGSVGHFALYDDSVGFKYMRINSGMVTLNSSNASVESDYFYTVCRSYLVSNQIEAVAFGSAQPQLTVKLIKNLRLPVPPLPEQRKIAQILSTWDRGIATTEKLIDTSKQQKKALMQQLLTGKKRLIDPETGKAFEGEWEEVKVSTLITKHSEKTETNKQYPVLTSSRKGIYFQSDYYNDRDVASEDTTGYNVVPRGYFTYRHMSDDLVFKFNRNTICDKGIVSTLYPVFAAKEEAVVPYLLQAILNEGSAFKRFSLSQKQGGSRTYMYLSKLNELKIQIPSLTEQQKITSALTAADKEIEVLKAKLAHLKQEKKALMQQLLTGKRRVKVAETEAA
jgi:type I restriction enzyme S subunit